MTRGLQQILALGAVAVVAYGLWSSDGLGDGRWLVTLGLAWLLLVLAVWPRMPRSMRTTRRGIVKAAILLATVFALLGVQLLRIQVVQQEATVNRVAADPISGEVIANPRLISSDLKIARGRVFDRTGTVIADTVADHGIQRRRYPAVDSAYVVGYFSPLLYGKAGLEARYDGELSGTAEASPLVRIEDDLLHRAPQGQDLYLTLDAKLQRRAQDLLAGHTGAVVLLDVKTGAVLTLASNPHFDPNRLYTASNAEHDAAVAYWRSLTSNPATPLVLRATDGLYTPGSTFKTVTASAAIDSGMARPDDTYRDDGSLNVDGHVIVEANRPDPSVDTWTLRQGLAYSLNVVFAQVGLQLGAAVLAKYAERFGFGDPVPFDLPVARSQVASSPDFLTSNPAVADTAFGQGELLVTPLQMAMVTAAIANDGSMMQPYLVDRVTTRDGQTRRQTAPRVWRRPIGGDAARQVREMMVNAVDSGYAHGAAIDGLVVGGKTGTAETGSGEPHAWFIGFVGDPAPRYAVAVVLEHGGKGLAESLTIGRQMLEAVMNAHP